MCEVLSRSVTPYNLEDDLNILYFLNDYLEKEEKHDNQDKIYWKQFYFTEFINLKDFAYSFNFIDNIKILSNIMKKDSILRKDNELINYLNFYFIRLLEEKKVIALYDNNSLNKIYILIFNTGLITPENKYIYSININNNKYGASATSSILPPGLEKQIIKSYYNLQKYWTCINFVDEIELDKYINNLSIDKFELNSIPSIIQYKKYISIAEFLFSPCLILKQSEIFFDPLIKINNSNNAKSYVSQLCNKFKKNCIINKYCNILCHIVKLDNEEFVNIIFNALDISIKKYSRNNQMIVHQYYYDYSNSKGSIQLLIPICLNTTNWIPHCVIGLKYNNNLYEISTILCLKFARLNARLISEFDNGLWNFCSSNLTNNILPITTKTIKDYKLDDTDDSINYTDDSKKYSRPCKHHFGLSGYKLSSCKNGDKCIYSHDISKVKICKSWQCSFCKNGNKCDFLHGTICNGKIKYV
jgi:hypothetical protein